MTAITVDRVVFDPDPDLVIRWEAECGICKAKVRVETRKQATDRLVDHHRRKHNKQGVLV